MLQENAGKEPHSAFFNKTTKQNAADRNMSDRWVILVRMDCIPASLLIYIL